MIILDTNVLSALMRSSPERAVVTWMDAQPQDSIWITSVTLFEAKLGLECLPKGKRRQMLELSFSQLLEEDLDHRVLEFDSPAAVEASIIAADRKRVGRPLDVRDTMIAGIAMSRRAAIATRNTRHFEDLSVKVVDPWNISS